MAPVVPLLVAGGALAWAVFHRKKVTNTPKAVPPKAVAKASSAKPTNVVKLSTKDAVTGALAGLNAFKAWLTSQVSAGKSGKLLSSLSLPSSASGWKRSWEVLTNFTSDQGSLAWPTDSERTVAVALVDVNELARRVAVNERRSATLQA